MAQPFATSNLLLSENHLNSWSHFRGAPQSNLTRGPVKRSKYHQRRSYLTVDSLPSFPRFWRVRQNLQPFRLDLNNPLTSVGGIPRTAIQARSVGWSKNPPTSVGGISTLAVKHQAETSRNVHLDVKN